VTLVLSNGLHYFIAALGVYFILTYLLNIDIDTDTDIDVAIFRQYRIDIVLKSKK